MHVESLVRMVSAVLNSRADGVAGGVSVCARDVGLAFAASINIERGDSESAYRVLGVGDLS